MIPSTEKLKPLLEHVFDDCREGLRDTLTPAEYERRKHDFVFHMTDWLEDLDELHTLYSRPEETSPDAATLKVIGFLSHVLPHLTTAGDLLLDGVANCFEPKKEAVLP